MPHSVPLISTIAAGFGLALLFGLVAVRLKVPALVGYLVAGVLLGPFTPGLTADLELTQQLAEIGVMLLMLGVGLHLSLDDLLSVRKIALQLRAALARSGANASVVG
jgi:CPA2 family monovalent cation:H+ antiporter-2